MKFNNWHLEKNILNDSQPHYWALLQKLTSMHILINCSWHAVALADLLIPIWYRQHYWRSLCNRFYIFSFGGHVGRHFWQYVHKLGKDIYPCWSWSPEPLSVFTAWNTFNIHFEQEILISIAAGLSGRCVSDAGFCRTLATLHLLDLRAQCLPYLEGRHWGHWTQRSNIIVFQVFCITL